MSPSQTNFNRALYRDPNLQIIFIVTLVAVMGISSISPAFPEIQAAFGISQPAVGLLIVAFTLPGVLVTPIFGVLADRYGRKSILVPSLLLFGAAGSACTLARDFNLLLALRLVQGLGAASLGSLNVTIIGDLYSKRQLATAMGYNASVLNLAVPSYLVIGGALASFAWYYPFALSVAAIPAGILVLTSLQSSEPRNQQEFKHYLRSALRSITDRQVLGLYAITLFTFVILFGAYLTYFPLLLGSERFHASPFLIGIITSSMGLTTATISSQLGKLTLRYSEKMLIKGAFILYALTFFSIPFVQTIWLFFVPTVIFGVAHGMNLPSVQTLLARLAPIENRAAFMSLNGMVLRLGQTLGPLVLGVMFIIDGFEGAFFVTAGIAVAIFFLASVVLK
ncbi:MAG TPA: MFS transporter [Methanomicrobia archaeon]|nr:MFS transporter [Methanomicrobia archaeon]